jgi:NAD(P)-dependent dehydrogenase (short-subunit alcohol dehydrogenase family)
MAHSPNPSGLLVRCLRRRLPPPREPRRSRRRGRAEALHANETRNRQILDRIPAARWGTPDDLKGPIVFLASAASNYLHGHILVADGGWGGERTVSVLRTPS